MTKKRRRFNLSGGTGWVGQRKRATVFFPLLFFALLLFDKLAVRSVDIIIVRVTFRLVLSFRDNARNSIYEKILQYLFRLVQTLSLLARQELTKQALKQRFSMFLRLFCFYTKNFTSPLASPSITI